MVKTNAMLVIVEIPSAEEPLGLAADYNALINNQTTLPKPNTSVEKLAENVWLIPLAGNSRFLAELLYELKGLKVVYHALLLSEYHEQVISQNV
jgi:hypothetical protein